ncbi:protein containing Cyclic nucleotide-binding domains [methanotrophic bacterial endosymbiont of Bathymodiolus sp.]|nr:protein containing Cyclic nucleotide-binding domains [methanotrophic bacterial endosymbiont of Bathymodiolus sp.]
MSPDKVNTCKKYLAGNVIFQALNSVELDKLLSYARTKNFKRNEVIFSKGDSGGQLYIILSGTITIHTLSEDGKESILAILEQGDVFGEMAMFTNECRTATATMHTSGETLIIERQHFIALPDYVQLSAIVE